MYMQLLFKKVARDFYGCSDHVTVVVYVDFSQGRSLFQLPSSKVLISILLFNLGVESFLKRNLFPPIIRFPEYNLFPVKNKPTKRVPMNEHMFKAYAWNFLWLFLL